MYQCISRLRTYLLEERKGRCLRQAAGLRAKCRAVAFCQVKVISKSLFLINNLTIQSSCLQVATSSHTFKERSGSRYESLSLSLSLSLFLFLSFTIVHRTQMKVVLHKS